MIEADIERDENNKIIEEPHEEPNDINVNVTASIHDKVKNDNTYENNTDKKDNMAGIITPLKITSDENLGDEQNKIEKSNPDFQKDITGSKIITDTPTIFKTSLEESKNIFGLAEKSE